MNRVVVAFEGESSRRRVCDILESGGIPVRVNCSTGGDVIRAAGEMGGAVVICGYKFPDMTASDLAFELSENSVFLVIAKSIQLDLFENSMLFRLPTPVSGSELLGSVRMLIQMQEHIARTISPKRRAEEETAINTAKEMLMQKYCMTEDEAHRFLQHKSMDTATKMSDIAQMLLEGSQHNH